MSQCLLRPLPFSLSVEEPSWIPPGFKGWKVLLYVTWVLFQFMCTTPATRGSLHECSRTCVALACLVPPCLGNICTQATPLAPFLVLLALSGGPFENTCTCSWFYLPREYMHSLASGWCWAVGLHVRRLLPNPLWSIPSYWLHYFSFLHFVFSNVSSDTMNKHILPFLRFVFSNMSSNIMNKNILPFLHFVFSTVIIQTIGCTVYTL